MSDARERRIENAERDLRLEEALRGRGGERIGRFDPHLHPKDRAGKWRETFGANPKLAHDIPIQGSPGRGPDDDVVTGHPGSATPRPKPRQPFATAFGGEHGRPRSEDITTGSPGSGPSALGVGSRVSFVHGGATGTILSVNDSSGYARVEYDQPVNGVRAGSVSLSELRPHAGPPQVSVADQRRVVRWEDRTHPRAPTAIGADGSEIGRISPLGDNRFAVSYRFQDGHAYLGPKGEPGRRAPQAYTYPTMEAAKAALQAVHMGNEAPVPTAPNTTPEGRRTRRTFTAFGVQRKSETNYTHASKDASGAVRFHTSQAAARRRAGSGQVMPVEEVATGRPQTAKALRGYAQAQGGSISHGIDFAGWYSEKGMRSSPAEAWEAFKADKNEFPEGYHPPGPRINRRGNEQPGQRAPQVGPNAADPENDAPSIAVGLDLDRAEVALIQRAGAADRMAGAPQRHSLRGLPEDTLRDLRASVGGMRLTRSGTSGPDTGHARRTAAKKSLLSKIDAAIHITTTGGGGPGAGTPPVEDGGAERRYGQGATRGGQVGRHVFIRGTNTHIPKDREWSRDVGNGVSFQSPAGGTDVYRVENGNRELVSTPGRRASHPEVQRRWTAANAAAAEKPPSDVPGYLPGSGPRSNSARDRLSARPELTVADGYFLSGALSTLSNGGRDATLPEIRRAVAEQITDPGGDARKTQKALLAKIDVVIAETRRTQEADVTDDDFTEFDPPNDPRERRIMEAEVRTLADSLVEAADSLAKASTPEPFSKSKTSNWVARGGGLPAYIQHIAHDLVEKRGMTESRAIQMAIGIVKRWARGGGKVDANTRAAASKAVAEWEALRAKAHANPKG